MRRDGDQWVVILAGGEGRRLRDLIRDPDGTPVPKQFSPLGGGSSLLRLALERAHRLADPAHVLVVVMERHRRWWESELARFPETRALVQPVPRGTGIAILHALVEILLCDRAPRVVILPSDHVARDETALDRAVFEASQAALDASGDLVVLGMPAEVPDPEYGWLVPAPGGGGATRGVLAFEEKPLPDRVTQLFERGALVNSFIVCATAWALLDLFRRVRPEVLQSYTDGRNVSGWKPDALPRVFRGLPVLDFALDLVSESLSHLRVLPAPQCGWIDLGTPERLARWREEIAF